MILQYVVYVYEEKDNIFTDDGVTGLDFKFREIRPAIDFINEMVFKHHKAVVFFSEKVEEQ